MFQYTAGLCTWSQQGSATLSPILSICSSSARRRPLGLRYATLSLHRTFNSFSHSKTSIFEDLRVPPLGGTRGDGSGEVGTADPGENIVDGEGDGDWVQSAVEVRRGEEEMNGSAALVDVEVGFSL